MVNMRLQRMRRNTTAISSTPTFPVRTNTSLDTTAEILSTTATTTSSPRITVSAPRSSGPIPKKVMVSTTGNTITVMLATNLITQLQPTLLRPTPPQVTLTTFPSTKLPHQNSKQPSLLFAKYFVRPHLPVRCVSSTPPSDP
ncbi:Uncharacterized protein APZ42_019717 [Daphnia magna]|uniref:Uncharacterized protein n=1 Tax=Daphnia magna TaxID=35525 RepID=A0A162CD85_9CRUS|nr:Uncharacterized protein APZ42_019717 [Daphnia magna]